MFQLLFGLSQIHEKNIIHRDLKPENVLFTEDNRVKICDFGSSKIITKKETSSTPYIVSRYYRAPELILGCTEYCGEIDIFAAGCIFVELFIKEPIFPGKLEGLQLFEHLSLLGTPNAGFFNKFSLTSKITSLTDNLEYMYPADFEELLNNQKKYDSEFITDAADLILKMLKWEALERITAKDALEHDFFKKTLK